MGVSKDSPMRRKSIAVTNQNKPTVHPRAKRRPHSIVPGDRLSPFAKARRSLAPRKSILKTFTNILHNDSDSPNSQAQTEPGSQPAYPSSSLDDTTNQSMDITRNFDNRIQDNTTRKSFGGRRVSFAESVHVRLIQNLKKDKSGNDSADNTQSSSPSEQPDQSSRPPTDENDYPGAVSRNRRRSSARYSLSEDMDITSIGPQVFLPADNSAIADEEFNFDDDEDSMDMTEVVRGELIRKRSLSMGQRTPLAQVPPKEQEQEQGTNPSDDMEQSQSFEESVSQVLSDDLDHSGPMDFTMPLSKSQRPPAQQDALWHALRQATHSGDTPIEPEPSSDDSVQGDASYGDDGMDLDDAVQRLMRARASLPSVLAITHVEPESVYNDSFSTENSFEDQQEQTMNLSTVYVSRGGDDGRQSMGSAMDESEVYGAIALPLQSTPRRSLIQDQGEPKIEKLPLPEEPVRAIFQPSSPVFSSTSAEPPLQQSSLPVFTPPPARLSPSKVKASNSAPLSPAKARKSPGREGFTAAFAPPVTRPSPTKRPRPVNDEQDSIRQSPAKRTSLAGKLPVGSLSIPSPKPQPKSLSPNKKAPFQGSTGAKSSQRSSTIRRPSGYFAKRKSLGIDSGSQSLLQKNETPVVRTSLKMADGLRRGSLDSSSVGVRQHLDQNQEPSHCDQEVSRQAADSTTITKEPPAPASRTTSPVAQIAPTSLEQQVVDVSEVLSPDEPEHVGPDLDDLMDLDATEQWRNAVQDHELVETDDPPISIQQFFAMTGIKFMDELTAPRRSMHPSQQTVPQPREPETIPLAEYVVAMGVDTPQLSLYSRVSKDLEAWIEKSKADFLQAEDEAAKITPELFTEYSRADEEGQAELLHQLQLIRTNTRALAKSDWYDWKLQWLEGLRITADQTFRSLETDAKTLETIRASAGDLIPALRLEYEEIKKELDRESAEVAEIEACDQEYLNELKASIAEQNIEVEALRAEVAESKAKLLSLQERLRETSTEKQQTRAMIDEAQRVLHLQKSGTRAEVFRLKDELESLEDLHMFRVTQVNANMFEYVYASQFRVIIPCENYVPLTKRVDVERLDKTKSRIKDSFPRLSDFLLRMAKEEIVRGDKRTTRQIIHRLSDYWSTCAQLRAQLKLLLIKFPVDIEIMQSSQTELPGFKAKVMIVFPSVKAKAFISFVFIGKVFSYWPVTINSLQVEVEVAYGQVE
ncbi:hypothetical protein C0993_001243 [Termitomyces sp. T159_Od127]|nr:hypothetical protein C0993_001243 [Termitomyces sp. T159_Od127]